MSNLFSWDLCYYILRQVIIIITGKPWTGVAISTSCLHRPRPWACHARVKISTAVDIGGPQRKRAPGIAIRTSWERIMVSNIVGERWRWQHETIAGLSGRWRPMFYWERQDISQFQLHQVSNEHHRPIQFVCMLDACVYVQGIYQQTVLCCRVKNIWQEVTKGSKLFSRYLPFCISCNFVHF